jgi:hypothetical protein
MLTAHQQERYARHVLLDGFDQDKLRAASFRIRGSGAAALWAARYLAASGAGRVVVDSPAWEDELRRLGPWTELAGPAQTDLDLSSGDAGQGIQAVLEAIREVMAR